MSAAKHLGAGVGTVWVYAQTGGDMVSFTEGDDIPAWAADQMGDHCFRDIESQGVPAGDPEPAPEDDDDTGQEDDEDEESDQDDESEPADYSAKGNKELKAEIDARNQGREDDNLIVPEAKNKAAYVAALVSDDAASDDA